MQSTGMVAGKVAVVTGAGRGIGREIALALAREGARVVVNDVGAAVDGQGRDVAPADEAVQAIRDAGGEAVANSDSVATWDGAHRIARSAQDAFGRLDIVINNAGILRDRIFHKMTQEDWDAVIGVHLMGSFYLSRAAADAFRAQESGAFVHMTSTSGLVGNVGQANYSAAKLGIVGLSKSIALDMARYNVRSNCIAPFAWSRMVGAIPTDTPEQQARVERLKTMTPQKNAPLAVFLASDAARDINGQIFATRGNEIFLMSQSRPVRAIHRHDGWTPQRIAEHMAPAFRDSLYPLARSGDVFCWDPL